MIEHLIEYCCRHKFIVILFYVVLTGAGVYVMKRTPVDAIPDLSENQVIVFTDWMGRSPKEIEDQITYPLSVNLQGLAGVKAVRSSSEFNFSMINIIFDDSVDFYFARTRVLERLALASTFLPERVVPYLAPDATALGQIFWYTIESDRHDLGRLRGIEDWYVRYQLNSVPGVAQVSSVGGFPREYQVDVTPERLRAYNVTLGDIYDSIARSNSSVGGRVIQKGNAEYLIRGVGWIRSVEDIRDTVITARNGVPIRVGDVALVQMGSEFRRSVLEKNGSEATGGVVMMRYGENPLEVTKRIKAKIREIQKGLPEGVRIIPFYDRTRLIESAIHTVSRVLEHELLIAAIAILLILTHARSVFVIVVTLPLSILFAFMLMRVFSVSSNIMSLSGIAISIGILVDQSIVMLENATHRLTQKFGKEKITGDTTDLVAGACRQVGRPIFFSVVIMVVSFLPVFALTGQEGKLFHPLAFTKTFALIGTAIISITLVPAIIPLLVRGRLSHEENNWIVRSVMEMYRPTLGFLMNRPKTVIWLFVVLLALGFYFARHLGREFMPPLDEGSIMDMPVTAPRASVTEVADDIKARDALLRGMPEIEMVVGKAGRADTPTDPSPLDMIETVITLRPREHWAKRRIRPGEAAEQARLLIQRLQSAGDLAPFEHKEDADSFIRSAANGAINRFDTDMRRDLAQRIMVHDEALAEKSLRFVADRLFEQVDGRHAWKRALSPQERQTVIQDIISSHVTVFMRSPQLYDVEQTINDGLKRLANLKAVDAVTSDVLAPIPSTWNSIIGPIAESFGAEREDFYERTYSRLEKFRDEETRRWIHRTNQEIFSPAMRAFASALMSEVAASGEMLGLWKGSEEAKKKWSDRLGQEFERNLFLWPSVKADLVRELDTYVRQLGWTNIWTQPIINRVDMLATGVRTQLAVMVFGRSLDQIQEASNRVADVLRGIPGAVDVVADQSVGKGYVEVEIDRQRAARYGVNVGDVQDVIEIALGGKAITTTVEGRERYPVRLRYARDNRVDEESIRRILVTSRGAAAPGGGTSAGKPDGMGSAATGSGAGTSAASAENLANVYLEDVAAIKVVEGPVMIKSENGLLRAYVQLNVRDRDIVGFVEEAQRAVATKVKPPEGVYFTWAGQFEHQVRARKTLRIVFPAVLFLIFVILYATYNDLAHALLMMLAVPGALAGGVIFQTIFGYNFSVAVWVGYIACFGMATETGIIMLVYLRDAIAERGGLGKIASLEELHEAVMAGAIHRLRPKLLTEGTAIVGLAPMLWAKGVGAEVIAPMAAPVLGGLLIADEVIDIFLPVLFYQVEARRWKKIHADVKNAY
ncbi:MAG: efflux RND transporter permease subunit [Candidatus Sumerlaeota bacterium]|nr:efflux RND transporter permease subunit [Candidatus Sumerlaeota bacterium]